MREKSRLKHRLEEYTYQNSWLKYIKRRRESSSADIFRASKKVFKFIIVWSPNFQKTRRGKKNRRNNIVITNYNRHKWLNSMSAEFFKIVISHVVDHVICHACSCFVDSTPMPFWLYQWALHDLSFLIGSGPKVLMR